MLFTNCFAITIDPTPSPTASDIGSLVIGIAFILLVVERIVTVVRLLWPHATKENGNGVASNGYATKQDILRLEERLNALTNDYKDLVKTSFENYNTFHNTVADLRVGQEVIRRELTQEVIKAAESVLLRIDRAEKTATNSHKHPSQE